MYTKRGIVFAAALISGCSGGTQSNSTGDPTSGDPVMGQPTTPSVDPSIGLVNPSTGLPPVGSELPPVPAPGTQNSECVPGTPKTTQLRRLTNVQYDNTVRDLLGVQLNLASSVLAPDGTGVIEERHWKGYQAAAAILASTIMTDAAVKAKVITCTTLDDACVHQVVTEFGARAVRRPLTVEEVTRIEALYAKRATLTETGTFEEGMQLVFEGIFSLPSFITAAELSETADGERFVLNDYELAARLSYLLWNTMPDPELTAAAATGSLNTSAQILAQATRMLADPKAHDVVAAFHKQYIHMGQGTRWQDYTRDTTKFPAFKGAATMASMEAEAMAFMDSVVFAGAGTFKDLMLSTKGFVNADLAPIYGVTGSFGADLQEVDLGTARPGFLTRAGFLAANSYFGHTSPIHRGAYIQKEVLCTTIGAPPPGAPGTPLPDDPALVTNRQKVDAQTAGDDCKGCHHPLVNPTGFAFEGFDAIGAVQTMDNGVAIDSSANVWVGSAVVPVTGAVDLAAAIAASPEAQRCYAKKWIQFAFNRSLEPADVCTLDNISAKLAKDDYTVLNLVADLTQAESFRYRALETEVVQ